MDIVDLFKLVTTKDSTCEHQQQQYLSPSECKSSKKTMRPFRFPQIGSSTNIPIAQSDPHRHRTLSLSNYLYNERNRRQSLAESTLTFQPVRHETLEKREILSSEKKLAVFHHNMNNHKVDTAVIHSEQDQAAQPSSPSPVSSYWNTDRIREWVVEETNSNERTTTPIIVKECNSITKNDLVDFYRRFRGETHTSTSAASFLYSNPSSSHHWYALDKYGKLIGFLFCGEKNKLLNNQQLLKIMPIIDILIEPVYERRRLLYTLLKNLYDYCESNGYTKIIGFVSTTIKRPQYSTKTNNSLYMSYINAGFLNCGYINNGRYIQMEATFMNNLKICKKAIQLSIDTLYEKEIKHFQQKQDTQQSITTNDSIEEYRKKNKNKKTVRFA